jgi:hypothetical protein
MKWALSLSCGCQIDYEAWDFADFPRRDGPAKCPDHGDVQTEGVEPRKWDWQHVLLSDHHPQQSRGGYTAGDYVVIFWDADDGSWGYCYYGVSDNGLGYESEDVVGYETPQQALLAAVDSYCNAED